MEVQHSVSQQENQPNKHQNWLHGKILEGAKYFGCLVTSGLRWSNRISNLKLQTSVAKPQDTFLPSPQFEQQLYTVVMPLLEYAALVWDPCTQIDIYPGNGPTTHDTCTLYQ